MPKFIKSANLARKEEKEKNRNILEIPHSKWRLCFLPSAIIYKRSGYFLTKHSFLITKKNTKKTKF